MFSFALLSVGLFGLSLTTEFEPSRMLSSEQIPLLEKWGITVLTEGRVQSSRLMASPSSKHCTLGLLSLAQPALSVLWGLSQTLDPFLRSEFGKLNLA